MKINNNICLKSIVKQYITKYSNVIHNILCNISIHYEFEYTSKDSNNLQLFKCHENFRNLKMYH